MNPDQGLLNVNSKKVQVIAIFATFFPSCIIKYFSCSFCNTDYIIAKFVSDACVACTINKYLQCRHHSPTLKVDYFKKPKNQATHLVHNP